MALFALYNGKDWHVALWKIEESVDEILSFVNVEDKRRGEILALPREARQKEKLLGAHLVNLLSNSNVEIGYRSNGAPYIIDSNIDISLTHTKGWIAVQSSSLIVPGIDIEHNSERVLKVAHKFVSDQEMVFAGGYNKLLYFNILWCAKEALYKICHNEGVVFTDNLLVDPFVLQSEGFLKGHIVFEGCVQDVDLKYIVHDEWYLVFRI